MAIYRVAATARADMTDVLRNSKAKFGPAARRRYLALIRAAFESIAAQPKRVGSYSRDELAPGLRSFHLRHARGQSRHDRVNRPRHIVFYRTGADGRIEIVRLLHEAMELGQHLSD